MQLAMPLRCRVRGYAEWLDTKEWRRRSRKLRRIRERELRTTPALFLQIRQQCVSWPLNTLLYHAPSKRLAFQGYLDRLLAGVTAEGFYPISTDGLVKSNSFCCRISSCWRFRWL